VQLNGYGVRAVTEVAVFNGAGATLTADDSTLAGNTAGAGGGGIYLDSGTVTLHDSTVTGNVPDNCAPPGAVAGCTGSQQRAAQDR
jgi:hypothetical protein